MKKTTTIILDMYGVILKERTGNFVPYTFNYFDESKHERLKRQFEEERLFTKAGYGELSSTEFLSLLGYQDTEYHMKTILKIILHWIRHLSYLRRSIIKNMISFYYQQMFLNGVNT